MEDRFLRVIEYVVFVVLAALVSLTAFSAYAEPRAVATDEDVRVIIYDEPCRLKEVTNAPYRATWHEGKTVVEGCFQPHPIGAFLFYFSDRTIALIPAREFKAVQVM